MLAGMENTLGSTQCRCGRRLVHVDSALAVCTYCRFLPAQCICQDLQDQPLEVLCTCTQTSLCTNDYPGCDFCRTLNSEFSCTGEDKP